MEAFDTNVIMRLLVRDDVEQFGRAEQAFRQAVAGGGAWIPLVVLVEISWVLRVAYKFDHVTIAAALRRLHQTDGVRFESEGLVLRALDRFENGAADFADYVILEEARDGHALPLHTFDGRLAKSCISRRATGLSPQSRPGGAPGRNGSAWHRLGAARTGPGVQPHGTRFGPRSSSAAGTAS